MLVANTAPRTVVEEIDGVAVTKVASLGRVRSTPLPPTLPVWLRRSARWADLFHFHFPFPTGEFSYLLAGSPGRMITTYHADIVRQQTLLKVYEPFLWRFLDRTERILVTSPRIIETSRFVSAYREKAEVVPLGIDADRFRENERTLALAAQIKERYGTPLVLFIGRLIYYKGIEYAIRAMVDLDARLLIIGDGDLRSSLEDLISMLRLGDKVFIIPPVPWDDLPAYYHACDLFVLPSIARSEAYGLVQLEAHACGKPVISTELGTGTSFVNEDGKTGFVVPPEDTPALAGAIGRLLGDDAVRQEMGSYAKERVFDRFTLERMAGRVAEIYSEVVGMESAS